MQKHANSRIIAVLAVFSVVVAVQSIVMIKLYRRLEVARTQPAAESTRRDVEPKAATGTILAPDARQWNLTAPTLPQFGGLGYNSGKWDPFKELHNMRQQMDQMFTDSFGRLQLSPDFKSLWGGTRFSPSMDVEENDDNYVISMDIPGTEKTNITINIEDRDLVVSGKVNETLETQGQNHLRKERSTGEFRRILTLPGPVIADEMKAIYENGVLTVTIPKALSQCTSRKIEVK